MKPVFVISAIWLLFYTLPGFTQLYDHHQMTEELIEELVRSDISGIDPAIIYDDLFYYLHNPLDINTAGTEELRGVYFLNELQIANLIEYRHSHGDILTVYEIQYIEGFSQEDVKKLIPFITVGEITTVAAVSPAGVLRDGRHQLYLRLQQVLQEQRGFSPVSDSALSASPDSRYSGSPLKIYNRYQFSYRNQVQAGIVAEKDPGEEFFRGSNPYGFDYYSAHLQINDIGKIKTIAVGDFQAGFGQGLILWSGLSFGKSVNTLNIKKSGRGIQKYSSTGENMFFRGAGLTFRLSQSTEGSFFVSKKKIDAGITLVDEEGRISEVSFLRDTGIHATPSQIEGKNVLGEMVLGGNINYNHRLFRIGATVAALEYDAVLNPPGRIYNQFDFRGSRNMNAGLDYQFSLGSFRFFGEGAISSSRGTAMLGGVMANLSSRMSLSALYRNYARDYHAYFSNGFRENTRTENEEGYYLGALVHPFSRLKLSAYFDLFSFPWMRYSAWAPSGGYEYFMQVDYNHSGNLNMYMSFKYKDKPVNAPSGESAVRDLYDAATTRLRYHVNYSASTSVELRNRLEMTQYRREDISPERGFLIFQDVLFRPVKFPLSFAFRYALFDTESYNARLYAYENDVLHAFSIPAYYDSGYRSYLLVKYTLREAVDIWLRYAITKLPGKERIGSGLNEVIGDVRSEIKAQVRMRF